MNGECERGNGDGDGETGIYGNGNLKINGNGNLEWEINNSKNSMAGSLDAVGWVDGRFR